VQNYDYYLNLERISASFCRNHSKMFFISRRTNYFILSFLIEERSKETFTDHPTLLAKRASNHSPSLSSINTMLNMYNIII